MDRASWAPTPTDIGSVIRARTKDTNGREAGEFNSDTRPTGDQVWDSIDTVTAEINDECGPIPDEVMDAARRTAAIGAAADIELSYWPEQINSGRSPYNQLYARYMSMLAKLKAAVGDLSGGGVVNNVDLVAGSGFPDACDDTAYLVGWQSQW